MIMWGQNSHTLDDRQDKQAPTHGRTACLKAIEKLPSLFDGE